MEARKENKFFYLCCTEPINVNKEFYELSFVKDSGISKTDTLNMIEAHGDEIVILPEYFINYGSSKSCKVEIFVSKDERYFGVQGHPEYTSDFHASRVACIRARYFGKEEGFEPVEKFRQTLLEEQFNKNPNSEYELRCLAYHFIKTPIPDKLEKNTLEKSIL